MIPYLTSNVFCTQKITLWLFKINSWTSSTINRAVGMVRLWNQQLTYRKQNRNATFGELNRTSASMPLDNIMYPGANKSGTGIISVKICMHCIWCTWCIWGLNVKLSIAGGTWRMFQLYYDWICCSETISWSFFGKINLFTAHWQGQ